MGPSPYRKRAALRLVTARLRTTGIPVNLKCGLRRVMGTHKALLCDPQTSDGLLVAGAPDALADVLATFARHGGAQASLIGGMMGGAPRVAVEL